MLGYTIEQLRIHLETRFQPGMTWDNYGKWEVDHVKPHCQFSYKTKEDPDFKACWALSNLRPLWKLANRRKGKRYHLDFTEGLG